MWEALAALGLAAFFIVIWRVEDDRVMFGAAVFCVWAAAGFFAGSANAYLSIPQAEQAIREEAPQPFVASETIVTGFSGCHHLTRNAVACKDQQETLLNDEEPIQGWSLDAAFLCSGRIYVYITDEYMTCKEVKADLHPTVRIKSSPSS